MGVVVLVLAMGVLAARAALRLELRWDTFDYHVPVAALRAGIPITYVPNDKALGIYQGFPPLPELVQGLLWRFTGSLNATGLANYLAFVIFLAYCHLALRASFWLVGLISLTAPLVLIHAAVSYVDLFGNAFLAIGTASVLFLWLYPERGRPRVIVTGAVAGLVLAAWSKDQLLPVTVVGLVLLLAVLLARPGQTDRTRLAAALVVGLGLGVAAIPYVRDWVEYGNPFWPVRLTALPIFPYSWDTAPDFAAARPPQFASMSQIELFLRSLFETNNPMSYPNRPRWIVDEGSTNDGLRMGGFWVGAVITYFTAATAMLLVTRGRRGAVAAVTAGLVILGIGFLPQSHDLRYYLVIPLTVAAAIGMAWPDVRRSLPGFAPVLLIVVLALFAHMASVNAWAYRVETIGWNEAAASAGATRFWSQMRSDVVYCAVGMEPGAILLTGPTMQDFFVIDVPTSDRCPAGSQIVTWDGFQGTAG